MLLSIEKFPVLLDEIGCSMQVITLTGRVSRIVHLNRNERALQDIKSKLDDTYRDFLAASALRHEVQQTQLVLQQTRLALQQIEFVTQKTEFAKQQTQTQLEIKTVSAETHYLHDPRRELSLKLGVTPPPIKPTALRHTRESKPATPLKFEASGGGGMYPPKSAAGGYYPSFDKSGKINEPKDPVQHTGSKKDRTYVHALGRNQTSSFPSNSPRKNHNIGMITYDPQGLLFGGGYVGGVGPPCSTTFIKFKGQTVLVTAKRRRNDPKQQAKTPSLEKNDGDMAQMPREESNLLLPVEVFAYKITISG
ncbi:hypothetical protein B0H19DRAFT_1286086 [Mycena capillaripes]|nr:hypothetical protein B0H19DRAFT_1286086 [Mycena capillaripes]